jgi:hypothetical protein
MSGGRIRRVIALPCLKASISWARTHGETFDSEGVISSLCLASQIHLTADCPRLVKYGCIGVIVLVAGIGLIWLSLSNDSVLYA